jgi:DME family drug/metabolite transporter
VWKPGGTSGHQPTWRLALNSTYDKPQQISSFTKGYLICLIGTAVWSTTAIFIRYLTVAYQLPALVLAFWRDVFVFAALAGTFVIVSQDRLRIERRHLRFLVLYGFVLSIFNGLWTISVSLNGAAVATVLVYSSAAFTALLGWRLFHEQLGAIKILAVLFSLGGCVLVSGAYAASAWELNTIGVITGLLSGLAFASYSLMGKASSERGLNSWTALLYTFGIGALFLLVYNLIPGLDAGAVSGGNLFWLGSSLAGWGVLLFLAIGPTVGGYGLYTLSLSYLPASVANLIATLEPAITAGLAYLFLGEDLKGIQLLGGLLIVSGVFMLRLKNGRGRKTAVH